MAHFSSVHSTLPPANFPIVRADDPLLEALKRDIDFPQLNAHIIMLDQRVRLQAQGTTSVEVCREIAKIFESLVSRPLMNIPTFEYGDKSPYFMILNNMAWSDPTLNHKHLVGCLNKFLKDEPPAEIPPPPAANPSSPPNRPPKRRWIYVVFAGLLCVFSLCLTRWLRQAKRDSG